MSAITTHVLDTSRGRPAAGMGVVLERRESNGQWTSIGQGNTDADGRARLADGLAPGPYRLVFHPPSPFFTRVELQVELTEGHYHVPLLISPYGCASYRGS